MCIRIYKHAKCIPSDCGLVATAKVIRWLFALLLIAAGGITANAQDIGRVFDQDQVRKASESLEAQLRKSDSAGTGLAETKLDAVTAVAVRIKSGRAEIHKGSDDVFVVLSGQATLVTGGTVLNPSGDEEVRGDSIHGGTSATLKKGDVIHIPHLVPHQLSLLPGVTFVYLLIKIPR